MNTHGARTLFWLLITAAAAVLGWRSCWLLAELHWEDRERQVLAAVGLWTLWLVLLVGIVRLQRSKNG